MSRPLENGSIARILRKNKTQREQPLDVGASQDPLSDAVFDVPTDAPADYGDAGAAPVLGNPNDDRLVEARGAMASPYFVDQKTSDSIAAGDTPVQFSGRYAGRTTGGPDDLRMQAIGKVDASDPRFQTLEERPDALAAEAGEGNSPKSFPTEQTSWGGAGGYNYTFIPTPDADGPGIIKVEGPNGVFTLDPERGMSERNTRAYGSILQEMATQGYDTPLHDREAPTAAPAAGAPAPEPGTEPEPGFTPLDEDSEPGFTPLDEETPISEMPRAEAIDTAAHRAMRAHETKPRPKGDYGGRLYDSMPSLEGVKEAGDRLDAGTASVLRGAAGKFDGDNGLMLKEPGPAPDRPSGDLGGKLYDSARGVPSALNSLDRATASGIRSAADWFDPRTGEPEASPEQPEEVSPEELQAFTVELLGTSFEP